MTLRSTNCIVSDKINKVSIFQLMLFFVKYYDLMIREIIITKRLVRSRIPYNHFN